MKVTVTGARETAGRLRRLGVSLDETQKRVVRMLSIEARRLLVIQMTGRAGWDAFWGKQSPKGPFLAGRTGQSRARLSRGGIVFKRASGYFSEVGSPDKHVKLHEEGGTIVATGTQMRMPLAVMQKPSGEDRNAGRSVRGDRRFRWRPGKKYQWLDVLMGSRWVPAYLLLKRATYRARRFFRLVHGKLETLAPRVMASEVRRIVRAANG